jgi:hypothetical protein
MRLERVPGQLTIGVLLAIALLLPRTAAAQTVVDLWLYLYAQPPASAVNPGQTVSFALYVGSDGPAPASGARLHVRVPAGLTMSPGAARRSQVQISNRVGRDRRHPLSVLRVRAVRDQPR